MSNVVVHDRLEKLLASAALNGLDFVEVGNPETRLDVHFLNHVPVGPVTPQNVTITGGEQITEIAVLTVDLTVDTRGRPLLQLTVEPSGDFSNYTLTVSHPTVDRRFERLQFSFKALCPSSLDCEPPPHVCPPPAGEVPAIDYLAKDFLSFRKALSDFSAARHPDWIERSEADFGMMFMEALCSVADDLSYLQDRIGFEATLETATQRRSVVRHARLVDYEPRPPLTSTVLLQFDVPGGITDILPGVRVSASAPDGSKVDFETGTGLLDTEPRPVNELWNRRAPGGMRAYYWDDADRCLRAGAADAWIEGIGHQLKAGTALLLDTRAAVPADPPNREVVHLLIDGDELTDPIFGKNVTHIVWGAHEALRRDHDITIDDLGDSRTAIVGNLVPATQGRRATDSFVVDSPPPAAPHMPLAVVRQGPPGADAPPRYFWTMREAPLAYLPSSVAGDEPLPEIDLSQQTTAAAERWTWKRSILNGRPSEKAFTTEPMRLTRVTDGPGDAPSFDVDGDADPDARAQTIRFGTGDFGASPEPGDVFQVSYRIGGGARGNVAADSISRVESPAFIGYGVTNPFPASGGADEEPSERIRRLAPQRFRAVQYRAVTPDDYSRAAETLDWVSRGGTTVRWTGSWLTIFTSADPKGNSDVTLPQQIELARLLARYRMAGRDVATPPPVYASLDITIVVCAAPEAFRGDVAAALLDALGPAKASGFFHHDRFTFGTPLYRGALEAAVQSSRGVAGIVSVVVRRRGYQQTPQDMPDVLRVGVHEIVRVDDDPSFPENGSLTLHVRGGK